MGSTFCGIVSPSDQIKGSRNPAQSLLVFCSVEWTALGFNKMPVSVSGGQRLRERPAHGGAGYGARTLLVAGDVSHGGK